MLAAYLALSAATVVAMALLRHDPGRVTSAVWTRGIVATISAAVLNHNHLRSVFADG